MDRVNLAWAGPSAPPVRKPSGWRRASIPTVAFDWDTVREREALALSSPATYHETGGLVRPKKESE